MDRLSNGTQVTVMPGIGAVSGTPGFASNGVPGVNPPSVVDGDSFNGLQEEIRNVLLAAGIVPSKTVLNQLQTALQTALNGVTGNGMPTTADLNWVPLGWQNYNTTTINTPTAGSFGLVQTISNNGSSTPAAANWVQQFAVDAGLHYRQNLGNAGWTAWAQIATSASVTAAVGAEATLRLNADNALNSGLSTEITARTNGDNALSNGLSSEITDRTNADNALTAAAMGHVAAAIVTGSRVFGTAYTNSDGRPIFVFVAGNSTSADTQLQLTVGGTVVTWGNGNGGTATVVSTCGVVPAGATYSVNHVGTGSATLTLWSET
jgi:hypothetical protein